MGKPCRVTFGDRVFFKPDFIKRFLDTLHLEDEVVDNSPYLKSIGYDNAFNEGDPLLIREKKEEAKAEGRDVKKVKVFRGTGNNVKEGENDAIQWVAEDRRVAENYSEGGKVEEMEVVIPSNPFEMPLNAIQVRGVDVANRLRTIRDKQFKDKKITRERAIEISKSISDFENKAGNELELYSTKTNKKESASAFVTALKALGFDGLVQKESYNSESPFTNTITGNETNTYGIFKEKSISSPKVVADVNVEEVKNTAKALEEVGNIDKFKKLLKSFSINDVKQFFHASGRKRKGKLYKGVAPQFGEGVYFSTNKDLVVDEFGDNVTEVALTLKNPVFTNTKEWKAVERKALELADEDYGKKNGLKLEEGETYFRYDKDNTSDVDEINPIFISKAAEQLGYDAIIDKNSNVYDNEISVLDDSRIIYEEDMPMAIAEEYNRAKADGSNPELVKAVDELLGKLPQATETSIFDDFDSSRVSGAKAKQVAANKAFAEKYGEDAAVARAISSNFEAIADELKAKGIFTKIEC